MQKTFIKRLIEEEVNRLFEQDKPPKPDDAKPDDDAGADAGADLGSTDAAADVDAGGGDLGTDIGGAVAGATGGGDIGGDATDAAGGEDATGTEPPVSSGSFGGTKSFDFGSSGSKGIVPDDDDTGDGDNGGADGSSEKDKATTVGPEDVEMPADPVMSIVDDAIKLLDVTQAPQDILKNVKYSIQQYFNSFDDATPVIKALWDTENVVLRDVAKRLLIFMRGN